MKNFRCAILAYFMVACAVFAAGQAVKRDAPPYPPEPADKSITADQQQTSHSRLRIDRLQIQTEAREISELAQTVPLDIDHVNRGMLPKDVIEKLKRIEKLAKHLRAEIAP